jgi:hypothetical protein
MFSGLRSRWMMPARWAAARPASACRAIHTASPGSRAPVLRDQLGERAAVEQLHHDVRADRALAEVEHVADLVAVDLAGRRRLVAEPDQQLRVAGVSARASA